MAAFSGKSRLWAVLGFVAFTAVAVAAAAYLLLSLPGVPDRDALYHCGHAKLYAERGPFMKAFPWTTYSVVRTYASDIWYGFHLLLAPFTFARDPVRGVKLAGVFDLAALLVLFYVAMRRAGMRLPYLWPFLVLGFTPFLLYRLLMTRPHIISMGLAALLLSCTVGGSLWGVGIVSFAVTFVHLGFFWVIPLVVGAVIVVKRLGEEPWAWKEAVVALAGGMAGWLLRPNPIGAGKLVYVQIVQLALEKQKGVALLFGADLLSGLDSMKTYPEDFARLFGPALILCVAAAVVLIAALFHGVEFKPRQRTLLWSSFSLSAITLVMMMYFSIRAVDLWAVFSVVFVAALFTFVLPPRDGPRPAFPSRRPAAIAAALGGLLVAYMFWSGFQQYETQMPKFTYPPDRFKGAAEWIEAHSAPGEVVFHGHWDLFPDLFFWNTENRYIGGMDPIFQYAYDPALYWKAHHLWSGTFGSYTCGTPACGPGRGEDTFTVLRRDFEASFLVLEKQRHAALYRYALGDPRFELGFEEGEVVVFALKGAEGAGG